MKDKVLEIISSKNSDKFAFISLSKNGLYYANCYDEEFELVTRNSCQTIEEAGDFCIHWIE